ncbi:Uncharacterised protein [Raoultella terrigena]|uniref:Uncharacterized protein n=1 Tax=Raoultella terrigena TaxID=577 RepID=A0A4U9D5S0_RAOTE|nr:Uncharacterised protein [Raoultella terrigena]
MARLVLKAEDGVAVVHARVGKVDIRRMIRAGAAGDNEFFCGDRFNGAVVTLQGQRMFINEVRVALQDFAVVALIESLTHMGLLVNDAVGMVKNVGEGGAKKAGVVAVERVLVELDNTADGMAERFRRDGSPVGTATADVMVAFNNGNGVLPA